MSALDRFHASWPRGVSPTVVEHFAGAADHVAPAMSLWSGAERIASSLSSMGLVSGDRFGCALPPGIRWAQTFIACLMRGVVFAPIPPGQKPGVGLRALVDESGNFTMATEAPPRLQGPGAVSLREGRTWTLDALDGVTTQLTERQHVRAGARLVSEAPWWEPSGLCAAWLGLSLGAELHVGLSDEELHRLGPDVVCARSGHVERLMNWVPAAPTGLLVVNGEASAADRAIADRRGWKLVSLALPA
ncbi:MAG: hypothetical protein JNM69_43195 [Archangium sp.]|nr:hypothetical protein [Archangium sp.]